MVSKIKNDSIETWLLILTVFLIISLGINLILYIKVIQDDSRIDTLEELTTNNEEYRYTWTTLDPAYPITVPIKLMKWGGKEYIVASEDVWIEYKDKELNNECPVCEELSFQGSKNCTRDYTGATC